MFFLGEGLGGEVFLFFLNNNIMQASTLLNRKVINIALENYGVTQQNIDS